MKTGRYTITAKTPDGHEHALHFEYNKIRSTINTLTYRTMNLLGHPCCGEGILGKNPHIANLAEKLSEAINQWDTDGHRLITTLKQAPEQAPNAQQEPPTPHTPGS